MKRKSCAVGMRAMQYWGFAVTHSVNGHSVTLFLIHQIMAPNDIHFLFWIMMLDILKRRISLLLIFLIKFINWFWLLFCLRVASSLSSCLWCVFDWLHCLFIYLLIYLYISSIYLFNFAFQSFPHPPLTSSHPMSDKLKLLSRGLILNFLTCMPLVVTHCRWGSLEQRTGHSLPPLEARTTGLPTFILILLTRYDSNLKTSMAKENLVKLASCELRKVCFFFFYLALVFSILSCIWLVLSLLFFQTAEPEGRSKKTILLYTKWNLFQQSIFF